MNFVSWSFVLLFAVVFAARLLFGRRKNERAFVWFTIVASTIFVMWHVPIYILVMLASVGVDYSAALIIDAAPPGAHRRRAVLALSMAMNLLILCFFKYADFFLKIAGQSLGMAGIGVHTPRLGLVLPIGISFYTFGSMSYTIDVYRGRLRPVRRFQDFYYFVTFFPHMVAGPIVRAEQFFYQFARTRRLHLRVFNHGIFLIVRGAFLKIVCADNIARVVNHYWEGASGRRCLDTPFRGGGYSGDLCILALLFAAQIFCDFEGYSSIARGLAYLLGYRFPINFRRPYIATSFSNFWERWHITLSRWLRDYLYIPLGGSRVRPSREYANLLIVMFLGGLWHGASLTFVCWGILHGTALAVERLLHLNRPARSVEVRVAWYLVVQATVILGWIFFRSRSVGSALTFIRNIGDLKFGGVYWELPLVALFMLPAVAMHLYGLLIEKSVIKPIGPLGQAALAGVMLFGILTAHGDSSEFLYFQF